MGLGGRRGGHRGHRAGHRHHHGHHHGIHHHHHGGIHHGHGVHHGRARHGGLFLFGARRHHHHSHGTNVHTGGAVHVSTGADGYYHVYGGNQCGEGGGPLCGPIAGIVFGALFLFIGFVLVMVGYFDKPLFSSFSSFYDDELQRLENCRIAGWVFIGLGIPLLVFSIWYLRRLRAQLKSAAQTRGETGASSQLESQLQQPQQQAPPGVVEVQPTPPGGPFSVPVGDPGALPGVPYPPGGMPAYPVAPYPVGNSPYPPPMTTAPYPPPLATGYPVGGDVKVGEPGFPQEPAVDAPPSYSDVTGGMSYDSAVAVEPSAPESM
eukprot:m.267852 g.267852  ORF g.267852 m.267852 type:complete len:320 (+) comp40523_c0_seq22:352-1311(+)